MIVTWFDLAERPKPFELAERFLHSGTTARLVHHHAITDHADEGAVLRRNACSIVHLGEAARAGLADNHK